jgi:hypothetical protein
LELDLSRLEALELKPAELDLLRAIRSCAGADGAARSLFYVAVVRSGLDYACAHHSLRTLEVLGYVRVARRGAGRPLTMRPTRHNGCA